MKAKEYLELAHKEERERRNNPNNMNSIAIHMYD